MNRTEKRLLKLLPAIMRLADLVEDIIEMVLAWRKQNPKKEPAKDGKPVKA